MICEKKSSKILKKIWVLRNFLIFLAFDEVLKSEETKPEFSYKDRYIKYSDSVYFKNVEIFDILNFDFKTFLKEILNFNFKF